jgi:hypothetical protein
VQCPHCGTAPSPDPRSPATSRWRTPTSRWTRSRRSVPRGTRTSTSPRRRSSPSGRRRDPRSRSRSTSSTSATTSASTSPSSRSSRPRSPSTASCSRSRRRPRRRPLPARVGPAPRPGGPARPGSRPSRRSSYAAADVDDTGATRSIEQLVENLHRADLNPIDRARAMREVVDSGVSQADLARKLGIAPSTVANDLRLLERARRSRSCSWLVDRLKSGGFTNAAGPKTGARQTRGPVAASATARRFTRRSPSTPGTRARSAS